MVELEDEVGTQDSVSDATMPVIGRCRDEIGVPDGTLTLKVSAWPPTRVTLTVQASAEALGSAAIAYVASIAAASASTVQSFRLLSNVVLPLHVSPVCAG